MKEVIKGMIDSYPFFAECSLQTFDDGGRKPDPVSRIMENKEENYKILEVLQNKGAGAFFSVNPMLPGKRDQESVTKVGVWICEIDGIPKSMQEKILKSCPLFPSLVIESKNSYHMYRFAKDGTKERWNDIANGLRNYFDGDPAVVDISRVLRLPGYLHLKNRADPYEITLKEWTNEYFTEEQMLRAYPDIRPITEVKRKAKMEMQTIRKDLGGDYFRNRVNCMNNKMMLNEISGSELVRGDIISFESNTDGTEQIWINGKSTGCWLDKDGMIGSKSGGGPTWISWVTRYNVSGSEIAKWLKKNHAEMCDSKGIPKQEVQEDIRIKKDHIDLDFKGYKPSRGLDYIDKEFRKMDKNGELMVMFGPPGCGKTEFGFFVAKANKDKLKTIYFCLEIPEQTILKRWALRKKGLSREDVDYDRLTSEEEMMVQKYIDDFKKSSKPYLEMISIKQSPTIEQLIEKMDFEYVENIVYIIDNLGKIQGNDDENKRYSDITSKLQTFAYNKKCWIILQHHTIKPPPKKDKSIEDVFEQSLFGPYGFRGSQKIFDNATRMIEIHRDYANNKAIMLQYKHTPTDTRGFIELAFDRGEYKQYTF